MLISTLLQITSTPADSAQVAAQAAEAASLSVFDMILKGGVVLIPIALLSLLSVYIMVERYIYIKKAARIDKSFMDNIRELLHKGSFDSARAMCRKYDSPIARVIEKGIMRIGNPIRDIKEAIETVGDIEMAKMEKGLNYLGLVAGIAPMLGFIGTIVGIIKIFYNISLADNISIGIIAGGLYEKMITSCAGLVVGVIAYAGYHLLNMMIDKFGLQIESTSVEFIDLLQEPTK